MSSFTLLLAATGFHCDLGSGWVGFDPAPALLSGDEFRAPFFAGRGVYRQRRRADGTWVPEVDVLGGDLTGVRVRACGREWTL